MSDVNLIDVNFDRKELIMESTPLFKFIIDEVLLRRIAEDEVKRLLEESIGSAWWDMKRLEYETCRKRDWLLANILLNPEFKNEMQYISNKCEGGRWMFRAPEMRRFLDKHFEKLNCSPTRIAQMKQVLS